MKIIRLGLLSLALFGLTMPSFALNPQPLPPGSAATTPNYQNAQQMNQKRQQLMQKKQLLMQKKQQFKANQ